MNIKSTELNITELYDIVENKRVNVDLPGVRIFTLNEGESIPEPAFQDLSVHTIIINSSSGMVTIARRRDEDPKVRPYIDPRTFQEVNVETVNWDVTHCYKGVPNSYTVDFPTQPLPYSPTLEQRLDPITTNTIFNENNDA